MRSKLLWNGFEVVPLIINLRTNVFFFFFACSVSFCFAFETDNFTLRYKPLAPADDSLDKVVNQVFQKVVEVANKEKIGCSEGVSQNKERSGHQKFRDLLQEAVAPRNVVGVFEDYVADNASWVSHILDFFKRDQNWKAPLKAKQSVPKHGLELRNSIYESSEGVSWILGSYGIAPSINLSGHYVGADKLGHFFDEGYDYYHRWSRIRNNKDMDEEFILDNGLSAESNTSGFLTTKIYSYADTAANYSGYLFWRSATEGVNPYFICRNNQWSQQRRFSWSDYVNASWDEAINCNKYGDATFTAAVTKNIQALEKKAVQQGRHWRYQCPVRPEDCASLSCMKYAKKLLHPNCFKEKKNSICSKILESKSRSGSQ